MREFRGVTDKVASPESNGPDAVQESPTSQVGGSAGPENFLAANKKYIVPACAVIVGFGVIALFAVMSHRPSAKQAPAPAVVAAADQAAPTASSIPTDAGKSAQQTDQPSVSPSAIQGTASQTTPAATQPLGAVQSFTQSQDAGANKLWAAPAYPLAAGNAAPAGATAPDNSGVVSARLAQVSKPSLIFVRSAPGASGEAGGAHVAPTAEEPAITNFGYQPGDHITTHLEMVATTATKAPVIAVVDYSYKRHGVTIIPAGSRIIGAIGAASSTGIMDIQFNSIHLPNGEDVSINAMGLNTQMGPIKGVVSGRNRSKEFLLATVAGLGGITAQFAGNNTSGALSEGDLIRSQTSTNLGSAADAGIGELAVKEHIVVTVAAGTQVEVTFTTAIKAKKPTVM